MFTKELFTEYTLYASVLVIVSAVQALFYSFYVYRDKNRETDLMPMLSLGFAVLLLPVTVLLTNGYIHGNIAVMRYLAIVSFFLLNVCLIIFNYTAGNFSKTLLIVSSVLLPLTSVIYFLDLKYVMVGIDLFLILFWTVCLFRIFVVVRSSDKSAFHKALLTTGGIFAVAAVVFQMIARLSASFDLFNLLSLVAILIFNLSLTSFMVTDETVFSAKFRFRTVFGIFFVLLYFPSIALFSRYLNLNIRPLMEQHFDPHFFPVVYGNLSRIITTASLAIEVIICAFYLLRIYMSVSTQIRIKLFQELSYIREKLFDLSNNPMLILKSDKIVQSNASAQSLMGMTDKGITDRSIDAFFHNKNGETPISSMVGLIPYISLEAYFLSPNGAYINCHIDITTLSQTDTAYRLCIIRDLSHFEREMQSARLIQAIYSILISGDYWHNRIKDIAGLIQNAYSCSMLYIYLQGYEGFYNYGSVDGDLAATMKKFYFDPELDILTEYLPDSCAVFIKIKTAIKQHGTLCLKISRQYMDDSTVDMLTNISHIIAQFLETTILIGELRSSERTYRVLSESSYIGIMIIQDGVIQYSNPRLTEISGYENSEIVGALHPSMFIAPEYHEQIRGLLSGGFRENERLSLADVRCIRKNGLECYVTLYYNAIEYRRKEAILLQLADVTAEIETLRQKEHITQLLIKDQKMKTLKNLVSGLSHEFNNVFAIIKGYVELMAYSDPSVTEKIADDLNVIKEATQRGIDITNRMHVFIRHDQLKRNTVDLKIFFDVSRPLLVNLIHKKNAHISFNVNLAPDALQIMADEFGLEEIFHNLIMNSVDSIAERGNIIVTSSRVDNNYVEIDFTDTGGGIPPDIIDSIFDPFFTTKGPDEGTGLGLYIVYELVKSMEGEIMVESEQGKGTTFRMIFPTADESGA